jgi:hypothetical protein
METQSTPTEKFWLTILVDGEQIAAFPDTKQGMAEARQSLQEARWDYPLSEVKPTRFATSELDADILS